MSTSYYIHTIPTKEKKQKVIDAINNDDVSELNHMSFETLYNKKELAYYAGGWQMSWNPYLKCFKKFNKKEIEDLLQNPRIIIYDEYNRKQDKEKFLEWAFSENTGYDSRSYRTTHPYEYIPDMSWHIEKLEREKDLKLPKRVSNQLYENKTYTDFKNDGLRWSLLMDSDYYDQDNTYDQDDNPDNLY